MLTLIRLMRVLALLVLTCLVLSLAVGIFRPETGAVEKIVLGLMIAGSLWLSLRISSLYARLQGAVLRRR
jgi:hypothetical protein